MDRIAKLREHAEFCADKLDECRDSVAGITPDMDPQAYAAYIAMAKELRLTVKQLAELEKDAKPRPSGTLSAMRLAVTKGANSA